MTISLFRHQRGPVGGVKQANSQVLRDATHLTTGGTMKIRTMSWQRIQKGARMTSKNRKVIATLK